VRGYSRDGGIGLCCGSRIGRAWRDGLDRSQGFHRRFNKTYEANDWKTYWGFYADDMTQYWEQGRLDIADYKTYWEKQLADGTKILEVKWADPAYHVSEANDAAVAAYRIYTKMRQTDGTIVASWHQETDVLFKRNGRWQVVHLHDSPAPDDAQKK